MKENLESEDREPEDLREFVERNIHKVRDCDDYYDEYYECKRFKGRFHQYFVFGKFLDCKRWKSDYENCKEASYDKEGNLDKLADIIRHEDERSKERLTNHLNNDVWRKRTEPPANWNSKLPDWFIEKSQEQEFLTPKYICVIF